jgi:hypothetical protein
MIYYSLKNTNVRIEHPVSQKIIADFTIDSSPTYPLKFGENIIINSTGRPIIIDIDKAGIAPTFTDIMTLFVFEARTLRFDLMDKFFRGDYDAELNKLGLPLETDKNNNVKLAVFITWLGWKMTTERFAEINLTRFFNVLTKYIDIKIKVEHI